ncbi:amidohydrolase [Oceanispirochaeta sp.]|jgi:amidohydrolase|uniref:amidohydrolase n=1 Tax=Oceanispirochaeta sp. TaxID=2035350 RepID=UPI0026074EDD|nr:amidohydrolase [Oceanispirochaeta sp.]MDA3955643.1 amidohydrolase [Oceanispirochaeta sp.]
MFKEDLKNKVVEAINTSAEEIIHIGDQIYKHPELGYKEFKTTKTVVDYLKNLDLEVEENIALTGCRSYLNKGHKGPRIALMGELDAIVVKDHPDSDAEGVVHACGHNIQIAGLLGAVAGLVRSGVLSQLDGQVDILAVPSEEFIELEYRDQLRSEEKIKFFGGKQELISRGYFDDIDMSLMFHSLDLEDKEALVGPTSNGFIGKKVQFTGRESHAGSAPELGVNALNAAMLAIMNIHAQRETFLDSDRVRVHPIITKGGDIVNVIPSDVRMEAYVRARTIDAMIDANHKVSRALLAGASAVGANIEITDIPGYLPILKHDGMDDLFHENLKLLGCEGKIVEGGDFSGSFDFGDVSHLMPTLHPMIGGVRGSIHTKDFAIIDKNLAYILPAKAMALTIIDLLYDGAEIAKSILDNFTPTLEKATYLSLMEENMNTLIVTNMTS